MECDDLIVILQEPDNLHNIIEEPVDLITESIETIRLIFMEELKYDETDENPDYLSRKIIAGAGITVDEGTGANAKKVRITNNITDVSNLTDTTGIIPSDHGDLDNLNADSDYLHVSSTEKSTWNGKADPGDIPTALSELSDDTTHRLVTDTEKGIWNGKQDALSGIVTSHGHAEIKDTAGTTYVKVDETAGQVNVQAANTTTSTIFQTKSGADLRFNVKGNGDIYNGTLEVYRYSNSSLYLGIGTKAAGNPANCVYVGFESGSANSNASGQNTGVGYQTLKNAINVENVAIGYLTGLQSYDAQYNTFVGARAGSLNSSGDSNVYLGASAGRRQTTASNQFLVANQLYASAAEELTNSILYGVMASTPTSQTLRINGALRTFGRRKAQATKTADYTITAIDEAFLIDGTSTGVDGTLPAISATNDGQEYEFKVIEFSNVCTLVAAGTDIFEGGTGTFTFSVLGEVLVIKADNTPATKVWRIWYNN